MRVITYNTHGSLGMDGRRSTLRIADVVRALTPDVVCFQELHFRLPWSRREDQPGVLADRLRRTMIFQRLLSFGFGGYGIGIATRGTVARVEEHLLPSRAEQRGALQVTLRRLDGLRASTIICTHWGLDPGERIEQAAALSGIVRAAERPVVVCGDLNEPPDGPAVQALMTGCNLSDAHAGTNRTTFVAQKSASRIDYILHSSDLTVAHAEIIESVASDHLPVVGDLVSAVS